MTREQTIAKYMKNLNISREEAIQLIADDENDVTTELTAEQQKVAKEMAQSDRKKETAPRKRERKVDNDKRFLIDSLVWLLTTDTDVIGDNVNATNVVVTNPEREVEFTYHDVKYRLTLMKPREKKEG